MKLALTATQGGLNPFQKERAEEILMLTNPSAVIHGACVGGDDDLDVIADKLRILRIVFPSNHKTKSALDRCLGRKNSDIIIAREPMLPLKRNPLIVQSGTHLLGFPAQEEEVVRSGTWTTLRLGRKLLGFRNVGIVTPTRFWILNSWLFTGPLEGVVHERPWQTQ